MRIIFSITRVLVAASLIAAVVVQLSSSISFAGGDGTPDTANVLINFFSYFTIDSNLLSAIIFLAGAAMLLRAGRVIESHRFTVARAAVTAYMILTGVVYNLLLRGFLVQGATVPWSNEILHVIAPIYLVIDWFFAPGRSVLRWRDALPALAFPIVWVIYTLVRGPVATDPYANTSSWYPYPFLNPVTSPGGYGSVALYVVGIAVVVIALAFGLTRTTRRRTGGDRAGPVESSDAPAD